MHAPRIAKRSPSICEQHGFHAVHAGTGDEAGIERHVRLLARLARYQRRAGRGPARIQLRQQRRRLQAKRRVPTAGTGGPGSAWRMAFCGSTIPTALYVFEVQVWTGGEPVLPT